MASLYLIRNIFSNYALVVITGLAGFVLTPLLFHRLQPANYAILVFALSVVAVMESLQFGLCTSLVRSVSSLAAQGKYTDLRRLASTIFYVLAGVGTLAALLLVLLSPPLADFFQITGSAEATGGLTVTMAGLSLAFSLPSTALRSFLEGCQDFLPANAVDISIQILRAGLTIILLLAGFGLLAIVALFPATALLRLVGLLVVTRRATIPFRPHLEEVNQESLSEIWHFASLAFLLETFMQWFAQLDKFLAARLLSLPSLAILAVARRLPSALKEISVQPLYVAYPLVSSAVARSDQRMIQKFLFLSVRNLLALALPIAAALFVWAEVILRFWIGDEGLAGVAVFRVFAIFSIFATLQEVPLTLLYGMGKIRFSTALSAVMLVAAVAAGVWAGSQYGLEELAIAYLAVQTAATLLLFRHALQLTQVGVHMWLRRAIAPVLGAALPTTAWFILSYWVVPQNLAGLVLSVAPGFLLFFGLFIWFVVGPEKFNWKTYIRKLLSEID